MSFILTWITLFAFAASVVDDKKYVGGFMLSEQITYEVRNSIYYGGVSTSSSDPRYSKIAPTTILLMPLSVGKAHEQQPFALTALLIKIVEGANEKESRYAFALLDIIYNDRPDVSIALITRQGPTYDKPGNFRSVFLRKAKLFLIYAFMNEMLKIDRGSKR